MRQSAGLAHAGACALHLIEILGNQTARRPEDVTDCGFIAMVNFTVLKGKDPVTDLHKEDFEVFGNGKPQTETCDHHLRDTLKIMWRSLADASPWRP